MGQKSPAKGKYKVTQQLGRDKVRLAPKQTGNKGPSPTSSGTSQKGLCAQTLESSEEPGPGLHTQPPLREGSGSWTAACQICRQAMSTSPRHTEPASTSDSPSSLCVTHAHLLGMKMQVLLKAEERLFCRNESVSLGPQRMKGLALPAGRGLAKGRLAQPGPDPRGL